MASISLDVEPSIIENNMRIVKDTPLEKELKTMFDSIDTYPCKTVKPSPGFCVKTFTKPDRKKLFVNVCTTDAIPCPRDITSDELKEILNSEDPSNYRLPMSLGNGRSELDKSGVATTVYDVAIHPNFMNKIKNNQLFKSFFLTVVFEGLQDKYQIEIDMSNFIVLKNKLCMGTLQTHRIQIRDVKQCEGETRPLIEEIKDKTTNKNLMEVEQKDEIAYRLSRLPVTGEVKHLLAEYKLPPKVSMKDLSLEAGEDRLILHCKQINQDIDLGLPYNIQYQNLIASYDSLKNVLSVEMAVVGA